MDKLTKLKHLAEKCPVQRFTAFTGKANTQAMICADTGIEIIGWSGFDSSALDAENHRVALARFIAAADPETILAMLTERAADKIRLAELDKSETQLIDERDAAHDAIAAMYEAVTGRRPEWSNWFGFVDAVEEVTNLMADRFDEDYREQ